MIETNEDLGEWTDRIVKECATEYPVRSFRKNFKTCVDAGANVGGFILNYHDLFEEIHAYEASSQNLSRCKSNLKRMNISNTIFNHAAVHSTNGEILNLKKHNNTENCGSYGVIDFKNSDGHGWDDECEHEEVSSVSLESIIDTVGEIDVLKVDVEGAEFEFLYEKDLSSVGIIFVEVHNFLTEMGVGNKLVDWILKTHKYGGGRYMPFYKEYHQQLIFLNNNLNK